MDELIPLTEPEVRVLLVRIVWPRLTDAQRALACSAFRRRHQAQARRSRQQNRGDDAQL